MTARLISIPASNYVEKARWALQLARVPFEEDKFLPVMHAFNTRPKGGDTVPLLYFPSSKEALADSSDILDFCAQGLPSLYPNEETKALELYYDKELGPHARKCGYFIVFFSSPSQARRVLIGSLDGWLQRAAGQLLFPLIRYFLLNRMQINEEGAVTAIGVVERMVQEADEKLGDAPIGTKFLAGDTFSAADIAFCAHMSLVVIPPEHAYVGFVTLASFSYPMRERVEKLQCTKSGQFVSWCYKHKRPAMLQEPAAPK